MDLQNKKCDHPHLPHSSSSEVEGVRIVVISFRNIAKKVERLRTFYDDEARIYALSYTYLYLYEEEEQIKPKKKKEVYNLYW